MTEKEAWLDLADRLTPEWQLLCDRIQNHPDYPHTIMLDKIHVALDIQGERRYGKGYSSSFSFLFLLRECAVYPNYEEAWKITLQKRIAFCKAMAEGQKITKELMVKLDNIGSECPHGTPYRYACEICDKNRR